MDVASVISFFWLRPWEITTLVFHKTLKVARSFIRQSKGYGKVNQFYFIFGKKNFYEVNTVLSVMNRGILFKVISLKLFYYQTFFETWRNEHS